MLAEYVITGTPRAPTLEHAFSGRPAAIEIVSADAAHDTELLKIYGSHYSTISRHKGAGALDSSVQLFLVREGGAVTSALLFSRRGHEVKVHNEVAEIPGPVLLRFASYIFSNCDGVRAIHFKAIQTDLGHSAFPMEKHEFLEDFVVPLPSSEREYLDSLRPSMRRAIRTSGDKIRRDFPTFSYRVYEGRDIDPAHILELLALGRARMAAKGKAFGISNVEQANLIALARDSGYILRATINGQVCGGLLGYRARDNIFMRICAHDSLYGRYRLGVLCQTFAIKDCIAAGVKDYHLLWGRQAYKYQLGAVPIPLYYVTLYRSKMDVVRNAPRVVANLKSALYRKARVMRANYRLRLTSHS